jgi:PAS fold
MTTPDPVARLHRWRQAIESASFGVWDLDPFQEMVHYSPQWKARLGFPRIHEPDSTGFWRCRVHPDDLQPMQGALRSHLDGYASSYEMRFRLRSNGSGYRTVLSRGRAVARDAAGNATRMVGTMVDLTGRPVAAAQHGLAAEDPGQAIESARLPLHAAIALASAPAGAGGSAGEGSQAVHEAHRLIGLISDLLDRALQEAGTTTC